MVSVRIQSVLPALLLPSSRWSPDATGAGHWSLITKYTLRSAGCQYRYPVPGTKGSTEKQVKGGGCF